MYKVKSATGKRETWHNRMENMTIDNILKSKIELLWQNNTQNNCISSFCKGKKYCEWEKYKI